VITLDPQLELKIIDSKVQRSSGDPYSALMPSLHTKWIKTLGKSLKEIRGQGYPSVILCSNIALYLVRTTIENEIPEFVVLSVDEIVRNFTLESIGVINLIDVVNIENEK